MSWAVTGGSGFVGLHLVRRLVAAGLPVRSLDLLPLRLAGVDEIVGDVRDPEAARRLCRGADVLVHAAAALPIRGSARELRSVNVDGTATVLHAARTAGVRRAVLVSSAVVYGLQPGPFGEEAAPAPIEPYGRTKVEAELLWRDAGGVILRPTAVVGAGRLGLFGLLFDWIREGRRVYTIGAGTNRYQLLAVDDLVRAIGLAAKRGEPGAAYNVGAVRFGTVAEELRALAAHAGSPSRVAPLPAVPARLALATLAGLHLSPLSAWHYKSAGREIVLDVSRARRELAWEPACSNGEALAAAYDSYVSRRPEPVTGRTHRTAWDERMLGLVRRLS